MSKLSFPRSFGNMLFVFLTNLSASDGLMQNVYKMTDVFNVMLTERKLQFFLKGRFNYFKRFCYLGFCI